MKKHKSRFKSNIMKKVTIALSLLVTTVAANAQTKPVEVHVKGGVALADQKVLFNNSSVSTDTRIGYMAEVGVNLGLGKGLSVQPAVAVQSLGYEQTNNPDRSVANTVIAIPVTLRYNVAQSGFHVYAGPQLGFLVDTKIKTSNTTTLIADQYKKTDVAAVFGAEYNIPTTKLLVGGRYQAGLTDIDNSNVNGSSRRQNAAYFYLGYRF